MCDFDDEHDPRIPDNPEYNDYLRAGYPGYKIPWGYELQGRQSRPDGVYSSHGRVPWWVWIVVILFILSMCAIAFGPML